jgi:hypothetical protein
MPVLHLDTSVLELDFNLLDLDFHVAIITKSRLATPAVNATLGPFQVER